MCIRLKHKNLYNVLGVSEAAGHSYLSAQLWFLQTHICAETRLPRVARSQ
jgi:hypothetical protein